MGLANPSHTQWQSITKCYTPLFCSCVAQSFGCVCKSVARNGKVQPIDTLPPLFCSCVAQSFGCVCKSVSLAMAKCSQSIHCLLFSVHVWHNHLVVCVRLCRSQWQSEANRYTASSFLLMCGTIMVVCVRVCRSQWQSEANRYTASSFLFMWHNYGCVCKSVSLAMARCSRSICCLLC